MNPVSVENGDLLPEWVVEEVDPEKMKTMAAILRDPNPIHWDVDVVRSLGIGDRPVNQGPNNMAYVVNCLAAFAGGFDRVRSVHVRFNAHVFAGDRIVAGGRVTSVEYRDGGSEIECELWLRRGDDVVLAGSGSVFRPEPRARGEQAC